MSAYDVVFLGGGPGGYVGAIRAAQRGARVAVIERDELGGVCLNRGCIPTKTLIASVNAFRCAKRLNQFGIKLDSDPKPDMKAMRDRMKKVVQTQIKGIHSLFKSNGINLFTGHGTVVSPQKIRVAAKNEEIELETRNLVIATGSRPAAIPGLEADGVRVLTSDDALNRDDVPERILIIGAGAIGCEWACIYSGLGSEVTLVEMLPRALPLEDEEISGILERELKKQKISLKTGAKISKLHRGDRSIEATLDSGDSIEADCALVSIGRAMNTDNIGLENIGMKKSKSGRIEVNERMETSVRGVYAIGDVADGYPMLAHAASAGGIVAAENITGGDRKLKASFIPSCTFTHPEVASVGLNENEAKTKGMDFKTGRFDFRALAKSHAIGEIEGRVKVVTDAAGKILGLHIIGHGASDLIHEGALAVQMGLTAQRLAEVVHAHPTFAEGILEAAEDVSGNAIHIAPKK